MYPVHDGCLQAVGGVGASSLEWIASAAFRGYVLRLLYIPVRHVILYRAGVSPPATSIAKEQANGNEIDLGAVHGVSPDG